MGVDVIFAALLGMQAAAEQPAAVIDMIVPAESQHGLICLPDRGPCLRLEPTDQDGRNVELSIHSTDSAGATQVDNYPLPQSVIANRDGERLTIWPHAIRLPVPSPLFETLPAYLVGVLREERTDRSDGAGSSARLMLYMLLVGDGQARLVSEVASLPWRGSQRVSVCFAEADRERRQGACHEEFLFRANLTIADADGGPLPALRFETQATAYPQTVRPGENNTIPLSLTTADLVHWRDPECSYTRTLRFNLATERYEMDGLAPDCSAYLVQP
jgi:hypothetical protein